MPPACSASAAAVASGDGTLDNDASTFVGADAVWPSLGGRDLAGAGVIVGVIDTGMQAQIRATDTADFPMLARFQDLKAQGGLSSAEEIAAHIAAMIADRNFGKAIVQDVRDWQPSA